MSRVAVIDVGSNSIKALVAEPGDRPYCLKVLFENTLETRISHGISGNPPMLSADRIQAGAAAVASLLASCNEYGPLAAVQIVATSAVRSAANGTTFAMAVKQATGHDLEILSGTEEAEAIAMGIRTDPAIGDSMRNFTAFDLGGGSLELIRFEEERVTRRCSLPLGSVRLTERFVKDPEKPIPANQQMDIIFCVESSITNNFSPFEPPLVGCSGGLAVLRQSLAEREGVPFEQFSPFFQREQMRKLTYRVTGQTIEERIRDTGLPPQRADIFPAALLTFMVILDMTRADGILHSLHNLRFGIAWKLLHAVPEEEGPANQE